jgi:hypothetical protein
MKEAKKEYISSIDPMRMFEIEHGKKKSSIELILIN